MKTLFLTIMLFFNSYYPAQYIAKLYTEILGRIPDQQGFTNYSVYFRVKGCNYHTLRVIAYQFLNSNEFLNLNLNEEQKIVAAFRGVLGTEPSTEKLAYYKDFYIKNGWQQTANKIINSENLISLRTSICNNKDENRKARYGWNNKTITQLTVNNAGFIQTEEQFYNVLRFLSDGSTVNLAPRQVIYLTKPLEIRKGITLQTLGNPSHYLEQARFVRANNFSNINGEPMIKLYNGASLKNVWVDGNSANTDYKVWDINVQTLGSNIKIENCKLENSSGFSTIQALGSLEGFICNNTIIENNLITCYNSDGFSNNKNQFPWVDGITVACENALVKNNSVVDSSDVGIVVFHNPNGIQASQIIENNIFNPANSSFAALNVDHIFTNKVEDFSGLLFKNNLIWTSDFASMRTVLSVGSELWDKKQGSGAFGASFIGNNSGKGFTKAHFLILVSMDNPIVSDNQFTYKPFKRCKNYPTVPYAVFNSFNFLNYLSLNNTGCM